MTNATIALANVAQNVDSHELVWNEDSHSYSFLLKVTIKLHVHVSKCSIHVVVHVQCSHVHNYNDVMLRCAVA